MAYVFYFGFGFICRNDVTNEISYICAYWVPTKILNDSKLRKILGFLIFLPSEINVDLFRTIVTFTPKNHILSIPSSNIG